MEIKRVFHMVLLRKYYQTGTNGRLFLDGREVCSTIELPWKQNARRISCIPEGTYQITLRYTKRYDLHLMVNDVPGRNFILMHAANDAQKELLGCIAPVTKISGPGRGLQSRTALKKILDCVLRHIDRGAEVYLTIKKDWR